MGWSMGICLVSKYTGLGNAFGDAGLDMHKLRFKLN